MTYRTTNFHRPKPLASIVVVSYNSEKVIERCLRAVFKTSFSCPFEVIFIDNASIDRSFEIVKEMFGHLPNIVIISSGENLGYTGGYNIGMKRAKGKYVVLLDPDTEVHPNWLNEIVEVMERDPTVGAAQSKLLMMEDRSRLEAGTGGFLDYLGIESRWSTYAIGERDLGQYDAFREIFYARGASMTVRRKALEEVGLFYPEYFLNYEDIDLCWRIRLRGYKVVFVPRSIVYHVGGRPQARKKWAPGFFHLRKNHIATLIRNYELRNLIVFLPLYILFVVLHAIYMLIVWRRVDITLMCLRSIFWNIRNFKLNYKRRLVVQRRIRKIPDKELKRLMTRPEVPLYLIKPRFSIKEEMYYRLPNL